MPYTDLTGSREFDVWHRIKPIILDAFQGIIVVRFNFLETKANV